MRKTVLCILCIACVSSVNLLNAQDLSTFEVIDNISVGLTAAPSGKVGMAIADIDGDGWQDILNVRWKGPGVSRIYRNVNGHFQDITDQSPHKQIEEADNVSLTRTSIWVDYDNDGDKDLSMGRSDAIYLFRNDNNVFTDVSQEMGFVGQKPGGFIVEWDYNIAGWADYDLDGDLDCAVSQFSNPDLYLFRNDGDHFTNVATEAGLDGTPLGKISRISWTDFDLDGDPDIHSRVDFMRNDNGVFTLVTDSMGLSSLTQTTNREFFDYDNDCDLDFFKATGVTDPGVFDELWENQDGLYVNVSDISGLANMQYSHRGITVGDFDNDGDQDVFLENSDNDVDYDILLLNEVINPGERVLADVAEFAGVTKTGDRKGCAFFDYDNDGFLDIYMPSAQFSHVLYHNDANNGANWIGCILEGTTSNRDAIGAIVTLYTGDKKQIRLKKCGNGFVRQDNPWIHFGVGFETSVDSIVIRWPLGRMQVISDPAINQYHELKEPGEVAIDMDPEDIVANGFLLEQNYPNPFNPATHIRYELLHDCEVEMMIYNVIGREVATLVDAYQKTGRHSIAWDGRGHSGNILPAGIYFYRIQAGEYNMTKKMVFVQ